MRGLGPALALAVAVLAGCSSAPPRSSVPDPDPFQPPTRVETAPVTEAAPRRGAFYKDDGPGENPPANLDQIPDAQPRREPLHRFANNPYQVFGRDYVPRRVLEPFTQRGMGSWYGRRFHGQNTSSGEPYDMYAMTAAHPTLPIPSYARVTNLTNGRQVVVRINDRGPFHAGRVIDLSFAAAYRLGYAEAGSALVEVESLLPDGTVAPVYAQAAAPAVWPPPAGSAAPAKPAAAKPPAARAATKPAPVAEAPAAPKPAPAAAPAAAATAPATSAAPAQPAAPAQAVAAAPAGNASAPAAEDSTRLPVTSDARGVYLQLGAFSVRDNAESFRVRIYKDLAWLNDAISIFPRDGLFRLQVGPYRTSEEARVIADRIRSDLNLRPVLLVR